MINRVLVPSNITSVSIEVRVGKISSYLKANPSIFALPLRFSFDRMVALGLKLISAFFIYPA